MELLNVSETTTNITQESYAEQNAENRSRMLQLLLADELEDASAGMQYPIFELYRQEAKAS